MICNRYCQRSSSVDDSYQHPFYTTCHQTGSRIDHSAKKDSACVSQPYCQKPETIRDNVHIMDNCSVCLKYNCYFSKCYDDSDQIAKKYVDVKQRYRNLSDEGCCCVKLNNASDIQEGTTMSL